MFILSFYLLGFLFVLGILVTGIYFEYKKWNHAEKKFNNISNLSKLTKKYDDIKDIDISNLSMEDLYSTLLNNINRQSPLTLSGQDNLNRHIYLDNKKLELVIDQLRYLKQIGTELASFKANILLLEENVLNNIYTERTRVIKDSEIAEAQHKSELNSIKALDRNTDLDLERKHIENLDKIAETAIKEAQRMQDVERAVFIKKVLNTIDINSLPPTLQTYITSVLFNPNSKDFNDYIMQEELKSIMKQKEINDVLKKGHEADLIKEQVNQAKEITEDMKDKRTFRNNDLKDFNKILNE